MNHYTKSMLERIETEYDGDYDIPPGPMVSWVEYWLLQAVYDLSAQVDKLQAQIDELVPIIDDTIAKAIQD